MEQTNSERMKPPSLSSFTCAKPRFKSRELQGDKHAPLQATNTSRLPFFAPKATTASERVMQNVDLFVLIAEKVTDTSALLNLFEACETARDAVEQLPKLMMVVLLNTLPLEIQQIVIAILALESAKLNDSAERARFINRYLSHSDQPVPMSSDPIKAFVELRDIAAAAETFTPLYISACMENLDRIEAARLTRNPPNLPFEYDWGTRPCWRWDGDEARRLPDDWRFAPPIDEARRAYLHHLTKTLYPWRFPAHAIEIYRVRRAFWRFELFCRLFPEQPTMNTGNNVELNEDRRNYLARLQIWECEELASVVPFLFKILERIYDPAVLRNQVNHDRRARLQWESFLAQDSAKGPRCSDEPSDWHREHDRELELRSAKDGWRLSRIGSRDNFYYAAELSHQKWLSHLVSKGLRHILASHQRYTHDHGKVFSRHYPSQRYEPSQFYNAPIETLLKWYQNSGGQEPFEDYALRTATSPHFRQWKDLPGAHLPSCCWDLKRCNSTANDRVDRPSLRDVGFVFWDARSKKES